MWSDFKNTKSWQRGMDKEDELSKLLTENGDEHHKATEDENKKQHIDFHIKKYGSCDVKAMKKFHSNEPEQDEYICIEFQDNQGNLGWVDSKTTDCIAFEFKNHYSIVKTLELSALARKLCKIPTNSMGEVLPTVTRKKPYTLYHRGKWGNNDIIGFIRSSDLDCLILEKIVKPEKEDSLWI